jgi:hypothetical protein
MRKACAGFALGRSMINDGCGDTYARKRCEYA